jgi:hypothetical protein
MEVAVGKLTGPLPVTVLSLKVSAPGLAPADKVHVHL